MKKLLLPAMAIMFALFSCDLFDLGQGRIRKEMDHDVFFQTIDGLAFRYDEFSFYDSSTHIFYLKSAHPELEDFRQGPFTFLEKGDTIYSGSFWPPYMSSIPSGPFISTPQIFYGNYVIRIEQAYSENPDPRNAAEMVEVLKSHDLLHSGLALRINTVEIHGDQADISFTVTNADDTDLLILDPDKMGFELFHYFTNGLYLYNESHSQTFFSNISSQAPVPGNSWNMTWLTELKTGESATFTMHYVLNSSPDKGLHIAIYVFPGLGNQVSIDQLYQGDARIWLGDVKTTKRIMIH